MPTLARKRPSNLTNNQPAANSTANVAAVATTTYISSSKSRSSQASNAMSDASAVPYTVTYFSGGGSRFLRSTRAGGTWRNCNSGGNANPISIKIDVINPS